jgi:hypothetical protein
MNKKNIRVRKGQVPGKRSCDGNLSQPDDRLEAPRQK